jgi:DNA (cytosine-5)-methyltransferase 1
MIGIDLFSGAGGMSLGAEWAGVTVKLAVELEASAFSTYARNHPNCLTLRGDAQRILDLRWSTDPRELVVFGGPPCQGFSTSNQRTRSKENEQNWLYRAFIGFVRNVRPGWVVFENVRGILETEQGMFAAQVERDLQKLGYSTSSGLLNAAEFGIPQYRSRFFIIARHGRAAPPLPKPPTIRPVITVADALGDLPKLEMGANESVLCYPRPATSSYAKRMRGQLKKCSGHLVSRNADYVVKRYAKIPPGGNWADIPKSMMKNYADRTRCHTGIYRRLVWTEPSVVIGNFRKNMLIHPKADRGLSVREAARLQSFPDSFVFEGSIGQQQQQVGNAVPPLLAQAVFRTIMQAHAAFNPLKLKPPKSA